MTTYLVQYVLEPSEPVAVSDWAEHASRVSIRDNGQNTKQILIEKMLKTLSSPFIILDYWQIA